MANRFADPSPRKALSDTILDRIEELEHPYPDGDHSVGEELANLYDADATPMDCRLGADPRRNGPKPA